MILHTVGDPEMIFPPKYSDVKFYKLRNGYAECELCEGKMIVRRVCSTNLADYLNKKYYPGARIQ